MAPTLAICIPTFERAELLERLLERLSHENVAVLVSDNASQDGTPEVLRRAADRSPRLTVHRQAQNVGPLENVRWLFANAPPVDYVWCFGDDDLIVPGGVDRVNALLEAHRPGWLFLPHFWGPETGEPVSSSPCPAEVEVFRDAGGLYRAYHHWLTFMSASILRRDLIATAVQRPTENRYAPFIWFFRGALEARCVVADAALVHGSPEISWGDLRAEIVTKHYVGLYDEAVHLALGEGEFGVALDGLYVNMNYLEFWRARPREELVATVERFPTSRNLRRFLFLLAREDKRPELFSVVGDAAARTGADRRAAALLAAGHERFAAGDAAAAAHLFREAVGEDPTLVDGWNDLAVALHVLGQSEVDTMLTIAVELDPANRSILLNRAELLLELGDMAGAAESASRLLELEPGDERAERVLAAVRRAG